MDIFVIESSPLIRYAILSYLARIDYHATVVHDEASIWADRQRKLPAMLVAEWPLPSGRGIELIEHIRSLDVQEYTYIILLARRNQQDALIAGLEAGADDYLIKPLDIRELRRRVILGRRIHKLETTYRHMQHECDALTMRDPLTRVLSRPAVYERVIQALTTYIQEGRPFSVMLLDLDPLAILNERHGYTSGDQALRLVADTLVQITRQGDAIGRWASSRFLVVLDGVYCQTARMIAQRIRDQVQLAVSEPFQHLHVRFGMVSVAEEPPVSGTQLIQQVEHVLAQS